MVGLPPGLPDAELFVVRCGGWCVCGYRVTGASWSGTQLSEPTKYKPLGASTGSTTVPGPGEGVRADSDNDSTGTAELVGPLLLGRLGP